MGVKMIAPLVATLLALGALTTPALAELDGDANCNGETDSVDALLVLQFLIPTVDVNLCGGFKADVNSDGRINAMDAAMILQMEAGLC